MTETENLTVRATGRLTGKFPADTMQVIEAEIREHGYVPERDGRSGIVSRLRYGDLRVTTGDDFLEASLRSTDARRLHMLREGFLHFLDHAGADLAERVHWTGTRMTGTYPPNFRLAKVLEVAPHSASYSRVRLEVDDLESFVSDGMHFRIWLPNKDRRPAWPHLSDSGRTVWPKGEDAMHNPVYTFSRIDTRAGVFDFDVFRHEGGRMTAWVDAVTMGSQVGLTGPGGGGFPVADWIVMGGDETALPAIRRILALSQPDRCGSVFIEVTSEADIEPLAAPMGVAVNWLVRGRDCALLDACRSVPMPDPATRRFVWFATEKSQVQMARKHFRDLMGVGSEESYFSGYWQK